MLNILPIYILIFIYRETKSDPKNILSTPLIDKMFFTRILLKLSFFEISKEPAFETFLPGKNFSESGFGVFCVCTNILYI